ncbi:hypothetical protein [Ruminococcus sp.]|uniref:hypothetical protein n=1 Tax=Ruminococcus sp. TaxID=41978 RepID=UPI00388F86EF
MKKEFMTESIKEYLDSLNGKDINAVLEEYKALESFGLGTRQLHEIAICYMELENYEEAGKTYEKAIRLAEQNQDTGADYHQMKRELKKMQDTELYVSEAQREKARQQKEPKQKQPKPETPVAERPQPQQPRVVRSFNNTKPSAVASQRKPAAANPKNKKTLRTVLIIVGVIAAIIVGRLVIIPLLNNATDKLSSVASHSADNTVSPELASRPTSAPGVPLKELATKQSMEPVVSNLRKAIDDDVHTYDKFIYGETYYDYYEGVPKYTVEPFGVIRYTIKNDSYVDEDYRKEEYYAVLKLSGELYRDENRGIGTPKRTTGYLSIPIVFLDGVAHKDDYNTWDLIDGADPGEVYDALDAKHTLYNGEYLEFD